MSDTPDWKPNAPAPEAALTPSDIPSPQTPPVPAAAAPSSGSPVPGRSGATPVPLAVIVCIICGSA